MFISFILLCLFLGYKEGRIEKGIASAVCIWTAYLFAMTEILSIFKLLTTSTCWACYVVLDIILIFALRKVAKIKKFHISITWWEKNYLPILAMGVLTFVLMWNTLPYNWDSMTYHLPRIMHWGQNQSVAHFATDSIRELTSPVLAEFVNLHVYLMYIKLGAGEYLFNMLQWGAYIANAVLVFLISRKLCMTKSMASLAAFLFMTMPIAFAESLTTQNDQYAAFWLLLFVCTIIDFYNVDKMEFNKEQIRDVLILSACIAFGYMAKPSILFGALFFAIGLLICCIRRKDSILCLSKMLVTSIGSMAVLLLPEMIRNLNSFNALSDPVAGARQLVGTSNPFYLFVNFLKNFVYNFPNVYFKLSWLCNKCVYWVAYKLHVDVDDISIAEDGKKFELHGARDFGHDTAINPIIVITCVLLVVVAILFAKRIRWERTQKLYCVMTALSFVVFCTFLRWEPYVTRYMLAYLACACPMLVVLLTNIANVSKNINIKGILITLLLFMSFAELTAMTTYHCKRIFNTKEKSYFVWAGEEYEDYREAREYILEQNYSSMGLLIGTDSYEYPIWRVNPDKLRIEHINVTSTTQKYSDVEFIPECIWIQHKGIDEEDTYSINGTLYEEVLRNDTVRVLERQE